ncbi:MAG: lmo0937 family membrane protein [Flavobacteriales bacterium]
MRNLLYIVAVVCVILWLLGFFGMSSGIGSGNLIHILLVIAVIALLLAVIRKAGK